MSNILRNKTEVGPSVIAILKLKQSVKHKTSNKVLDHGSLPQKIDDFTWFFDCLQLDPLAVPYVKALKQSNQTASTPLEPKLYLKSWLFSL